jgi:molybdopterin converting factor small subunit
LLQLLRDRGHPSSAAEAPRVKELLDALQQRFPGLGPELAELAVAIDGQVHHDAAYEPLSATSEVYFVPKIAGGCSADLQVRLTGERAGGERTWDFC